MAFERVLERKGVLTAGALLSSLALVLSGCGQKRASYIKNPEPIVVPASAQYLGVNDLNAKEGYTIMSGKAFEVPSEDVSRVECPDILQVAMKDSNDAELDVVRRVDHETTVDRFVVSCLYPIGFNRDGSIEKNLIKKMPVVVNK